MLNIQECNKHSEDFANDPTIPKPVITREMENSTKKLVDASTDTKTDTNKFNDLSPECQALLQSNINGYYGQLHFSNNKSPYDILEQPFGFNSEEDLQHEITSFTSPISPRQHALVQNSTLTQQKNINTREPIGINNFNPFKFCKFTDPFTIQAIENIGASEKDLFYPTDSQLLKYNRDPKLKEIVKRHQIQVTDKLIQSVITERERIYQAYLQNTKNTTHARTQQPTARNSNINSNRLSNPKSNSLYSNNRSLSRTTNAIPISKKRAIEQILIAKIKFQKEKQIRSLSAAHATNTKPKQTQENSINTNLSDLNKNSLLTEKVASGFIRAREIQEKKKEERERLLAEHEIRAQKRLEELQIIKIMQNEQIRAKNLQKKQQNEIFTLKQKNEELQRKEEADAIFAQERLIAQQEEENKKLASEHIRLAHGNYSLSQSNNQIENQLNKKQQNKQSIQNQQNLKNQNNFQNSQENKNNQQVKQILKTQKDQQQSQSLEIPQEQKNSENNEKENKTQNNHETQQDEQSSKEETSSEQNAQKTPSNQNIQNNQENQENTSNKQNNQENQTTQESTTNEQINQENQTTQENITKDQINQENQESQENITKDQINQENQESQENITKDQINQENQTTQINTKSDQINQENKTTQENITKDQINQENQTAQINTKSDQINQENKTTQEDITKEQINQENQESQEETKSDQIKQENVTKEELNQNSQNEQIEQNQQKSPTNQPKQNECKQNQQQAKPRLSHPKLQIQQKNRQKHSSQDELIQSILDQQYRQQSKSSAIQQKQQIALEEKRARVESSLQAHEERLRLQREAEQRRQKEHAIVVQLAAEDIKRRREMQEKAKLNESKEKVRRTMERFEIIERKKSELKRRVEIAQRTPINEEEAQLCLAYEKALELQKLNEFDEAQLAELAKKIGINYNSLKIRIIT